MESMCEIRCSECNVSIHQFASDCADSQIYDTICKHVHLLTRYLAINTKEYNCKIEPTDQSRQTIDKILLTASQLKEDRHVFQYFETGQSIPQNTLHMFA